MAGKLRGKKGSSIFEAKNMDVHVVEAPEMPKMPEMKPEVTLKKVGNGFIANKYGSNLGHGENQLVFKTYDEAVETCKPFMTGDNAKKE